MIGTVLDRPEVVAEPVHVSDEIGDRLRWLAGDFLRDIPSGADTYLLSRILHDWPDTEAAAIVRACAAAMEPGARLCLLEQIAPDLAEGSPTDQSDFALKDLKHVGSGRRTGTFPCGV